MSEQPQPIQRDESASIYQPDPILGQYIGHHPSNRLRLLIIGGIIYAVPVLSLQLIFWNVENAFASVFLPVLFAIIAGAVFWWMLHHWNREVVLYQRGFSYRQGSVTAYILYSNVVRLHQRVERVEFLGIARKVYHYTLITDIDETIVIDNIYNKPDKLTRMLETFIARDRLPIMHHQLSKGAEIPFTPEFRLSQQGLHYQEQTLAWADYKAQRIANAHLTIQARDDDEWARLSVATINNPVLLILMLKERGQIPHDSVIGAIDEL
ncbi:MAG: DUF6585 family protein [Anaerolineae bacterium]